MKHELIVFIKCSGPNVREDNLNDTITSFAKKNTKCDYKFYIVCDPHVEPWVNNVFENENYLSFLNPNHLLSLKVSNSSWATDFNEFFEAHQDNAEWILISHDDVEFITDDYFHKIKDSVKGHENKVGWITSTSNYYVETEGKVVTDTFRAGNYKDFSDWGAMFYLHKMKHLKNAAPNEVASSVHLYDYPKAPVKVHGVMSAIMLAKSSTIKKIGYCEDWTNYTMLIDEDWSLEALKNKLWNVWVPDVFHKHPLRRGLRPTNNKWEKEAHEGFINKWGFDVGSYPYGISIPIEEYREKYKDTNMPWSSYRTSYDWEYLDEQ